MDGRAPSSHTGKQYVGAGANSRRVATSQCTGCAGAGQQLHDDRSRNAWGQGVADQVVASRKGNESVRRYEASAAGNQLLVRREHVYVRADVAILRGERNRRAGAGVSDV